MRVVSGTRITLLDALPGLETSSPMGNPQGKQLSEEISLRLSGNCCLLRKKLFSR